MRLPYLAPLPLFCWPSTYVLIQYPPVLLAKMALADSSRVVTVDGDAGDSDLWGALLALLLPVAMRCR